MCVRTSGVGSCCYGDQLFRVVRETEHVNLSHQYHHKSAAIASRETVELLNKDSLKYKHLVKICLL